MTETFDTPILAFDVGGTKIAAAIVAGKQVRRRAQLDAANGPRRRYRFRHRGAPENFPRAAAVGLAVTGIVDSGELTALNPATLPIEVIFRSPLD